MLLTPWCLFTITLLYKMFKLAPKLHGILCTERGTGAPKPNIVTGTQILYTTVLPYTKSYTIFHYSCLRSDDERFLGPIEARTGGIRSGRYGQRTRDVHV